MRHWEILRGLMGEGQTIGPLVMDAIAAMTALEDGATLCTTDRNFSRFPGLKWTNPLASAWIPQLRSTGSASRNPSAAKSMGSLY